jgi:hypothetical protein
MIAKPVAHKTAPATGGPAEAANLMEVSSGWGFRGRRRKTFTMAAIGVGGSENKNFPEGRCSIGKAPVQPGS